MSDSERVSVTIYFTPGHSQTSTPEYTYTMTRTELDRLVDDWRLRRPAETEAYDVEHEGEYRKLMLRFADVLFIG